MSERPKRAISKPSRYVTTSSSDEAPPKQRRIAMVPGEVYEDIQDIRRTLEEDSVLFNDNNNISPHSSSYTHIHQSENIPHIEHTNFQSSSQRDTIVQSNTRSYINMTPRSVSHNIHTSQTTPLHIMNTHDYDTLHVGRQASYADNTFVEFQDHDGNGKRDVPSKNWNVGSGGSTAHHHHSTQPEKSDIRKIHERLDRVEAEMKRVNSTLEKILRCVQDRQRAPRKPAIFPIASLPDMDAFERLDEDGYSNAVNYFRYIGGFNLREAVNICLKESLKDTVASSFTWWGREGQRSLYNTRLIMAIYDGVCQNRHFETPTRSEFQAQMREALRMSKERHRSRSRRKIVPRGDATAIDRDLWNDEPSNENTEDD